MRKKNGYTNFKHTNTKVAFTIMYLCILLNISELFIVSFIILLSHIFSFDFLTIEAKRFVCILEILLPMLPMPQKVKKKII